MADEASAVAVASPTTYRWTDEDTAHFVRWRVMKKAVFTGGRTTNVAGYTMYLEERGLLGKVTTHFLKKKWENLKQKYREFIAPPTGLSTEEGASTAASWKWFNLMHEVLGEMKSTTPPVLIATKAGGQDTAVDTPPCTIRVKEEEEEEGGGGGGGGGDRAVREASTMPKRRKLYMVGVLEEMKEKDEEEWKRIMQEEQEEQERTKQIEERREANKERRHREILERQELWHREMLQREETWREEMRVRDERRDREAALRDERFLAILEALARK